MRHNRCFEQKGNQACACDCSIFFIPYQGIKVKLLDFKSVPGESSEIVADHLMSPLNQHDLVEKVVGFCCDNCNTDFGGVRRRLEHNIFQTETGNQKKPGRDRICSTHNTQLPSKCC